MKIAVLGASGIVGKAMLSILYEKFPNAIIKGFASENKPLKIKEMCLEVDALDSVEFGFFDVVISALPTNVARVFLPKAIESGCFVVDNSSAFREDLHFPLVVPEVNSHLVRFDTKLVASPNCIAIPLSMALQALHSKFGLKAVNVSTYQAVSGAGNKAVDELISSTKASLFGRGELHKNFVSPIGFNVVPYIDDLEKNLYTKEEMKIFNETKKIINFKDFDFNITSVRVPVFNGHSMAVNCKFSTETNKDKVIDALRAFQGIKVVDEYLTPLTHGVDTEFVYISRVRPDLLNSYGVNFWIVSDNVLKGAALNTIQIVEKWLHEVDLLESVAHGS